MPSSKCHQLSLELGELYNDVRVVLNLTGVNVVLLQQFSEAAKRIDELMVQTEKDAYDAGYSDGMAYMANQSQGKSTQTVDVASQIEKNLSENKEEKK
jgi:hypothetical protein